MIPELARESGARGVYWNEIAQAEHQAVEKRLEAALAKLGIESQSFPGDPLVPPSAISNKEGQQLGERPGRLDAHHL
ncbi:deoxyribodipyrimidine photo-lyase [Bradyrhizobium sp. Gha]|uniref:deoxyribodipyrimidine photo-lyase n=1 Tax=Bradyrhizobium sp. Gha TaxID=1855318 RepID=UPI0008F38D96|nr:deoxyribodipyrimidine photo-lyase [Bradyrhizobium sp. Gha]SFJ69795.1 deoxyribodipyrimidine photo-lyase [Bradyrhizobium sp. Gha]